MTLESGTYAVEWLGVERRETMGAGEVTIESPAVIEFTAPSGMTGPAVLYLKAA